MSPLAADVRDLLAAVRDALDIPLAHWDADSERAHDRILTDRAGTARIVLDGILDDGHHIPAATDYLTRRTADTPVTYRVWVPDQAEGGEQQ